MDGPLQFLQTVYSVTLIAFNKTKLISLPKTASQIISILARQFGTKNLIFYQVNQAFFCVRSTQYSIPVVSIDTTLAFSTWIVEGNERRKRGSTSTLADLDSFKSTFSGISVKDIDKCNKDRDACIKLRQEGAVLIRQKQ